MTVHAYTPPLAGRDPHRVKVVGSPVLVPLSLIREVGHSTHNAGVERPTLSPHLRARIEAEIGRLIALLDTADAPVTDVEPDGEAEPGGAWLQPVTLALPVRPVQVIRPSRAQQRAAYRAIGAPVPRELRGLIGRAFA